MADIEIGRVPKFECTAMLGGEIDADVEAVNKERAERRTRSTVRRRLRNGSFETDHVELVEVECEPR